MPKEPAAARVQPAGPTPDEPAAPDQPARALEALPALPLVMRAAQFAADRHKAQRRRGAAREPYVNHLLEVAALLAAATDGRDPELVIAGLLHDLIEDQGAGADDITRQFGIGVAALVLEVTTDKSLSEDERSRAHILHAAHKSPRARMLRIADLTSNLRALRQSPPGDWSIERQRDYFRWAHEVVARSRGLSASLDAAFDEAYDRGLAPLDTAT
ncbi:MAG: HD domain-containing protein [Alphaproteobacteria bacterium]|nr:HD domain-containing protein [Alphaproteobacteria bacterium]